MELRDEIALEAMKILLAYYTARPLPALQAVAIRARMPVEVYNLADDMLKARAEEE